jgi:ADP-ribosyl-[dinitrogen reductase] hydrolase
MWAIDTLTLPDSVARIGLCACPGQLDALKKDLPRLREWGATGLVTLLETHELELLGVTSLAAELATLGLRWWHLPIRDMEAPNARFEARWRKTGRELHGLLNDGLSIAVHCRAGKGRTGTVAARLLVERGTEPAQAIAQVRNARPGSIETREQEQFVHRCTHKKGDRSIFLSVARGQQKEK